MNRYITLDENNKVVSMRFGQSIVEGEIQSDIGELGQIMQTNGTFIDDPTPQPEPPEPIEVRLERMENTLDLLLLKQEGII